LPRVGWVERQVRQADRFQQRHVVLAVPWAVAQKFGDDEAGGKAALMAYCGLFALFPFCCCWRPSWASCCPGTRRCARS
jgi:hypothetical protein